MKNFRQKDRLNQEYYKTNIMRIGIDGRPLQEKFGGVKEYALNLLHALFSIDQKNEYHVFYNSFGQIEAPNFKKYQNVHTHRFRWPNKFLNLSLRLFNWPKLDKLISPKLNLFFLPNLNFTAFSRDFKHIATIHDLSFHHFPNFYSLKHRLWHKALNYKRLLSRSAKIITVSEHTKDDLIETFNLAEEKIEVIYPRLSIHANSISVDGANRIGVFLRPYILFLGILEPRKNIESIIEAYKILRKKSLPCSHFTKEDKQKQEDLPKLVVAGSKGWRYKTIFKTVDASVKNDIVFLNPINEEEKISLYQNAKLFVFPSFYEGFGLPPLEAASFGVPVIASSASSLPEVLKEAAFYINPWNVVEMAEAMNFLLHNDKMRLKLSKAGKERAKQFSALESAKKLLRVFEEAAKTKI